MLIRRESLVHEGKGKAYDKRGKGKAGAPKGKRERLARQKAKGNAHRPSY